MNIVTELINYKAGLHAETHPGGLAPWEGISLFLDSLTNVLSVPVFFIFETPREVLWLSEAEKCASGSSSSGK